MYSETRLFRRICFVTQILAVVGVDRHRYIRAQIIKGRKRLRASISERTDFAVKPACRFLPNGRSKSAEFWGGISANGLKANAVR